MNPKIENNIDWKRVNEICGGNKDEVFVILTENLNACRV